MGLKVTTIIITWFTRSLFHYANLRKYLKTSSARKIIQNISRYFKEFRIFLELLKYFQNLSKIFSPRVNVPQLSAYSSPNPLYSKVLSPKAFFFLNLPTLKAPSKILASVHNLVSIMSIPKYLCEG